MDYFEHYKCVNDLSDDGRRKHWGAFSKTIGRFLPEDRAARIVDVGCGAGLLLEWLQYKGYSNARGIDPDQGQVEFCRSLGLQATQVDVSSEWLTQQENLDIVVFKDILEHIPEEEVARLLDAAKASLAPEGKLYISVPNAAASYAGYWLYNDPTHLRSYTSQVLSFRLKASGLRVVHVGDDDTLLIGSLAGIPRLVFRSIFRFIRRLEAMGEFGADGMRMPLGLNLVVVAALDD